MIGLTLLSVWLVGQIKCDGALFEDRGGHPSLFYEAHDSADPKSSSLFLQFARSARSWASRAPTSRSPRSATIPSDPPSPELRVTQRASPSRQPVWRRPMRLPARRNATTRTTVTTRRTTSSSSDLNLLYDRTLQDHRLLLLFLLGCSWAGCVLWRCRPLHRHLD